MKFRPMTAIALFGILLVAGSVAAVEKNSSTTETAITIATQGETCCFTNPRFTGTCEVTPGADESCGSILGYLNNPNSVGRAYCGNTKVRGGWAQVDCEGSAGVTTEASCRVEEHRE